MATLYLSVYGAANFYHLIEPPTGFVLMGLITLLAGGIAIRFDSMLVAVLGIIGGYGTPLMLPTEQVNFVGLYGYMLVLGIGVLAVCYWKNWPMVNLLSFVCTYALFFYSLSGYSAEHFAEVMPFLVAFFMLFSTMTFLYKLVNRSPSNLLDLAVLLINAGIFFAVSRRLVTEAYGSTWVAAVTLGLAAFYTLHVYYLLARRIVDRELLVSFIGLATLFLAMTMPILLSPQWVTASWSVEALVLLWVALQLGSVFLQHVCYLLFAVVIGRFAIVDLPENFLWHPPTDDLPTVDYLRLLVERLVGFGVPTASLAGASWLLAPAKPTSGKPLSIGPTTFPTWPAAWAGHLGAVASIGLALVYLNLELHRTAGFFYAPLMWPMLTILWLAVCGLLLARSLSSKEEGWQAAVTLVLCGVLGKLLLVDLPSWNLTGLFLFAGPYSFRDAAMRLIDFGSVAGFFAAAFALTRRRPTAELRLFFAGCSLGVLLVYTTLELNSLLHFYLEGMRYGGISILWSLFALGFLLRGIVRHVRGLRYAWG